MVGTSATYTFELTAPGGALLPTGSLSWVSVLPTHRREGVLTEMMRAHFEDCRERGEAASALDASESEICRRFGFDVAGRRTSTGTSSAMRLRCVYRHCMTACAGNGLA